MFLDDTKLIQVNNGADLAIDAVTLSGPVGDLILQGPSGHVNVPSVISLAGGGVFSGTWTGSPTLTWTPTWGGHQNFSGGADIAGGAFSGTFTGNHTYSGQLTLSNATTLIGTSTTNSTTARLTTASGQTSTLEWYKGSNVRWRMQNRSTAETGFNAGSPFAMFGYDDSGNSTGTLWFANRASGGLGNGRPYFTDFAPYDMVLSRVTSPGGCYTNNINLSSGSGGDAQPVTTLGTDPLSVTNGSPTVTITWTGACTANGPIAPTSDKEVWVNLTGATAVGGITPSGWLLVQTVIDANTFTVTWTANATSTATGGGSAVTIQPSYCVNGEKFVSNHTTGAHSFSIQKQRVMYVNPLFYQTSGTGTVQYQHTFTQMYTAPENSGTGRYGHVFWEADLINRGGDFGYSYLPTAATNPTVGMWIGSIDRVAAGTPGGGTSQNWGTVFAVKGQYGTTAHYQAFCLTPSSLVGAAVDPTGHGGVGFDLFGSYQDLSNNPFATTNGTSTITVTAFDSDHLDAVSNGDTVRIPNVYTLNGVTFGGGNYTVANKTSTTFTITGTGTASASGSGGGTSQYCYFAKQVPHSPVQLWGSWKHGIITTNYRSESGYVLETQPGYGVSWSDGSGTASINTSATSAGNIDLTLSGAGTGHVKAKGPSGNVYNLGPPGLYATGTSVGNGADTSEDTLQTYTLPANTLANVGDRLHIVAGGTFAATTDTKTVRIRFGGISGVSISAPVGNAAGQTRWAVDAWIIKTGSNAQTYMASGGNGSTTNGVTNGTMTKTDTASIDILVTGQNSTSSSAGSITCQYYSVDYIPAP